MNNEELLATAWRYICSYQNTNTLTRSVGALYLFFSFTFFLLDQKETKNQGQKKSLPLSLTD
jgi:hypothetical protein